MPMKRIFSGTGNRITAGNHVVHVTEVSQKLSSKNDPMTVIAFETDDEKKVNYYAVHKFPWAIEAVKTCIECAGLPQGSKASQLVGKRVGITVEEGKPDDKGRTFMQIVGFGTEKDVQDARAAEAATANVPAPAATTFAADDDMPF